MFFALAYRLPAYAGALAAIAAQQRDGQAAPGPRRGAPKYDRTSAMANNARTAAAAPPTTAASLQQHNAQLGGWFAHQVIPAGGAVAPDLRESAQAECPELRGSNV